jgi:hypothetical protein
MDIDLREPYSDHSSDEHQHDDQESIVEHYTKLAHIVPHYETYPPALDDDKLQILAETYQLMTSKRYYPNSQGFYPTEKQMMEALNELRTFLAYEADRYGLRGFFREIHRTIVLEDLDDFPIDELLLYVKLFKYDLDERVVKGKNHLEIATMLYIHMRRRLEKFRELSYAAEILFGKTENRSKYLDTGSANFPIFQTVGPFNALRILERGPDFYFLRVGELTIDGIRNRFDFRESFQILMMFRRMNWNRFDKRVQEHIDGVWKITTLTFEEDVVRALIATVYELALDPRIYLVLDGPQSTLMIEPGETPISIADNYRYNHPDEKERLLKAVKSEGISTKYRDGRDKPAALLFTEYTVSQLSAGFSSHYGDHRYLHEASVYDHYTTGELIDNDTTDDKIFFGRRDGFSKVVTYNVKELYETFKHVKDFYDPVSIIKFPTNPYLWYKFPRRTIKRLVEYILPGKLSLPWTAQLIDVCREILAAKNVELEMRAFRSFVQELARSSVETKKKIKRALHRMYNVGLQFVGWDEMIDYYDDEMVHRLAMQDPLFVPPESHMTGRVRAECTKLIMLIQDSINEIGDEKHYLERLFLVRPGPSGSKRSKNGGLESSGTKNAGLDLSMTDVIEEGEAENVRVIRTTSDFDLEENRTAWFAKDLHIAYDDSAYTIGQYLPVMYDMAKYNLSNVLRVSGMWLMSTANVYHKLITGISLNHTKLEFIETNEGFEQFVPLPVL